VKTESAGQGLRVYKGDAKVFADSGKRAIKRAKKPEESANSISPSAEMLQNVTEFYEAVRIVKTEM